MKVTIDFERRIVLVDHCGAWLELSPEAARSLAHDLVMRAHELKHHDDMNQLLQEKKKYETPAIRNLSSSKVNELLSDAGRPERGVDYHIRKQMEEKQEKQWKANAVSFKKRIENIEAVAVERDLKDCEVKAMLKYFPPSEDADLMTPFDESS